MAFSHQGFAWRGGGKTRHVRTGLSSGGLSWSSHAICSPISGRPATTQPNDSEPDAIVCTENTGIGTGAHTACSGSACIQEFSTVHVTRTPSWSGAAQIRVLSCVNRCEPIAAQICGAPRLQEGWAKAANRLPPLTAIGWGEAQGCSKTPQIRTGIPAQNCSLRANCM